MTSASLRRLLGFALVAACDLVQAYNFGEWLEVEGKRDGDAVQEATCWCKEISELVAARIETASTELQGLEASSRTQHFENQQLRLKVKEHTADAKEHEQALGEAAAIYGKADATGGDHAASLQQALDTIRAAMEQAQSGSAASSTLSELEGMMSKKLQAMKEQSEASSSQFEDLRAAKQKMLRLSKAAAEEHERRLADGEAAVAQANGQIQAFTARKEADVSLASAIRTACKRVEEDAQSRAALRQEAAIALSNVKVQDAQQAAQAAAEKLISLSQGQALRDVRDHGARHSSVAARLLAALELRAEGRRDLCPVSVEGAELSERLAEQALDGAKGHAGSLMQLVAKAHDIEVALGKMLQAQLTAAHVTEGRAPEELKAIVDKIFRTAQEHAAALPEPFQEVQAKGKECSLGDQHLVTELMSAKADAEQRLVDAKRCHR